MHGGELALHGIELRKRGYGNMRIVRETQTWPPLVLLHAFPLDGRMWREQLSCLSSRTTVVAPDVPGFGQRVGEAGQVGEWTVGAFAFDVLRRLDNEGIEKVVLGGCSMGGYVAFEFWRRYPARVAGLILCDTRAEADSPEVRQRRQEQIERIRSQGTEFLAQFVEENLVSPRTQEKNPALVQEIAQWAREAPAESVIGVLHALANRPDSTETLETIHVPVLLVFGEDDKVTPPECGVRMLKRLSQATMEIIPEAGHLAPLENPAVVNSAIEDFLNSLSTQL